MRFFRRSEKNPSRVELKKHKFNINHMLRGWCLEKKKREWVKKPGRNYTDFLRDSFNLNSRPLVVHCASQKHTADCNWFRSKCLAQADTSAINTCQGKSVRWQFCVVEMHHLLLLFPFCLCYCINFHAIFLLHFNLKLWTVLVPVPAHQIDRKCDDLPLFV